MKATASKHRKFIYSKQNSDSLIMIPPRVTIFLLFCSGFVVALFAFTIGIYFDGGSDIYSYQVISGHFTSTPVPYFSSFGFYPFSSNILAELYKLNPHISWFDIVVFLNITLVVFLLLVLLYIIRSSFSVLLIILYTIPWLDNVLIPELTKQGFWIALISLLIYHNCHKSQRILRSGMFFLFAYAFTIRAEPVFLAFISFYLYLMVYAFTKGTIELRFIHKQLLPFVFVIFSFYILLNVNFTAQDKLYKSFRPYQFTLWDFKQDPSTLKLSNASDSAIFMAAQNHFISDVSKINEKFLKKIELHRKDKTLSSLSGYFENNFFLSKKIVHELHSARYYLSSILVFSIIVLIALLNSSTSGVREKKIMIGIFCTGLLLLAFLCIFMKLERHVVLPMLMGSTLYLLSSFPQIRVVGPLQLLMVALGSGLLACNVWVQYEFRKSTQSISSEFCRDVNSRFPDSIVYIDLYSMVKLHGKLFEKEVFPYERSLSFDNAIISYYPEWKEKMAKLKQPSTIEALTDEFVRNPEKTIFIFYKGREKIFEKYFYVVYGKNIAFKEILSPASLNINYPYSYYLASEQSK